MVRHVLLSLLIAGTAACTSTKAPPPPPAVPAAPPETPLIERAKFFGNPTKTKGLLSPDGQWLSWIAPRDGVLNVWVAPVADPSQAKPITSEKIRPIFSSFWSPDSKSVLFINDNGGDENYLLYGVEVASGTQRNYTPFEKTRAEVIGISRKVKNRILIGLNNRDARWHDVHSLDLKTGKLTLVRRNDGYAGFVADDDLRLRLAQKPRKDGGVDHFRIVGSRIERKPFVSVGLDDAQTTAPLAYTADGKTLYWSESRNRDKAVLVAQDVATGRSSVIGEDARADVSGALYDPRTGRAQAYAVEYLTEDYVPIDPAIKADLDELKRAAQGGLYNITSRTDADDKWLVTIDRISEPLSTWLYDRPTKKLTQLFVSRPELAGAPLVPMYPQEIPTRDGLTMVSYLSLPKAIDTGRAGGPTRSVPMVLFVHGGPWARDSHGYHSYHQWLANRGYAVLSVNFRGSTGFGKKFISAGDLQWGRKMHDDLLDAVDWAVQRGITTADKVAIMGGSYGGYATLAGMAFTPTTFACGVDIVGPSNLQTLLKTVPPYWEAFREQMYRRVGNPTTPEGVALLKERSPLNSADKIVRPLLIGQGANDPRVNVAESDQIVAAMEAKQIPVTYVLFPDEGHGFARPVNNIAFNAVTENFLAQCLGGRAEPIGDTLKASTAQVKHGAEFAQGLKAAIDKN